MLVPVLMVLIIIAKNLVFVLKSKTLEMKLKAEEILINLSDNTRINRHMKKNLFMNCTSVALSLNQRDFNHTLFPTVTATRDMAERTSSVMSDSIARAELLTNFNRFNAKADLN